VHDCTIQRCRTGLGRDSGGRSSRRLSAREAQLPSSLTNEREVAAAISQSPHGGASDGRSPPLAVGRRTWGRRGGGSPTVVDDHHRPGGRAQKRYVPQQSEVGEEGGPLLAHIPPLPHPGEDDGTLEEIESLNRSRDAAFSIYPGLCALFPGGDGTHPCHRELSPAARRPRSSLQCRDVAHHKVGKCNVRRRRATQYINVFRNENLVAWRRQPFAISSCRTNR
jgi:hypothetical protein